MESSKKNPRNNSVLYLTWLFSLFLIVAAYVYGYQDGYDDGELLSKNQFMDREVNLVGSYFDEKDNLQLNTFSCTPNNEDGDCSKKIIENYVSISQHWLNYCKKLSNAAFTNSIQGVEELRSSLENTSLIPFGMPTARCNDGTLSYSDNRSGTCSSHGGVDLWR